MNNCTSVVSRYIGIGIILGSALWVALLVEVAQKVQAADYGQYAVTAGPLLLDHIVEHHTRSGSTLSITFESGLIWYAIIWFVVGIVGGLVRWRIWHE